MIAKGFLIKSFDKLRTNGKGLIPLLLKEQFVCKLGRSKCTANTYPQQKKSAEEIPLLGYYQRLFF
jgi:competence protein ComGF